MNHFVNFSFLIYMQMHANVKKLEIVGVQTLRDGINEEL